MPLFVFIICVYANLSYYMAYVLFIYNGGALWWAIYTMQIGYMCTSYGWLSTMFTLWQMHVHPDVHYNN